MRTNRVISLAVWHQLEEMLRKRKLDAQLWGQIEVELKYQLDAQVGDPLVEQIWDQLWELLELWDQVDHKEI